MAQYNNVSLQKFGLIDDNASPATRVSVSDTHEDTSGTFRAAMTPSSDTEGIGYVAAFRSIAEFAAADLDGIAQAETYTTGHTDVQMVAVTPDLIIQWYRDDRVHVNEPKDFSQVSIATGMYTMIREGGKMQDHDVYVGNNGLHHLAPENGGWNDSDNDNTPDGYTATSLVSEDFTSNVYSAFVDTTSGTGSLNVTIPFPIDDEDVTLSVQVDQVHDDGTQAVRIEALDASKSTITGGIKDVTISTTGRKSATLTTPSDTHYLKLYPARVTSVSANTSKFQIQDPALRVDGETTHTAR